MTRKVWLGTVALLFAWGFVVHAVGLLLHEVGGHGTAAIVLGCGIGGIDLTYFGHGVVHYAPCERWTWGRVVVADWSGLALTIGAGAAAMLVERRLRARAAGRVARPAARSSAPPANVAAAPMTRVLLAVLGTAFLLGQLAYATSGGFHDLYDPARTARALGARGLHVLAWAPALALFAWAAFAGARAIVDALREQLAPRSRLHALGQTAATLGVAGLLYFVAFRIEWTIRSDLWMRGVAYEAHRRALARHEAAPFPISLVLLAIAVAAFVAALARPVGRVSDVSNVSNVSDVAAGRPVRPSSAAADAAATARDPRAPAPIPRAVIVTVATAALLCLLAIRLLGEV